MITPVAHGYIGSRDVTRADMSGAWAAGGVVSTAVDVEHFFHALLSGELIAPELLSKMKAPGLSPNPSWSHYGLGLAELDMDCASAYGHGGEFPGS